MGHSLHRWLGRAIALPLLAVPLMSGAVPLAPAVATPLQAGLCQALISNQDFALTIPTHWLLVQRDAMLVIYNQPPLSSGREAPPYMIKTDAGLMDISLAEAVAMAQEPSFGEGEMILRQEPVRVGDRTGVRFWAASGGDFPNSIATYLEIGDQQIAYIISFYSVQNQYAEAAILAVHNSFRMLAD